MKIPYCMRLSGTLALLAVLTGMATAQPANRIRFNNQDVFLNGGNIAWINFAADIGPGGTDLATFETMFRQVHQNGGNAMRFWMHTSGSTSPAFSNGVVVGPGAGTIEDLKAILDLAWKHEVGMVLCLWSFDMLRISNGATLTDRAHGLLTDSTKGRAYINEALIPMVEAVKGHPAIIAWEVFNEPEGMSNEFGWDLAHHVPMLDIQRFINWTAGAIHRTDPSAQVTNGSWSFKASTDKATTGSVNKNYYRDDRLIAAGGDEDGTLDFYTVHYYEWAGTSISPFHYNYAYWELDKPLVVAEFYLHEDANDGNLNATYNVPAQNLYTTLFNGGYAGALAWQWIDWHTNREPEKRNWPTALENMRTIQQQHPTDVDLVVEGAHILDFYAEPAVILKGESSILTWEAGGATTATLDGETVDLAASTEVAPTETKTYTFIATGSDATADTATVTITVLEVADERYEFEDAARTGQITVVNHVGASAGKYVEMRDSGTLTFSNVVVPESGLYRLIFGFRLPFDTPKSQNLTINGAAQGEVTFAGILNEWLTTEVTKNLTAGANTLIIEKSWGWMAFDYLEVLPATDVASEGTSPGSQTRLDPIYPNPTTGRVHIAYVLATSGPVTIDLFDPTGRRIATVVDERQERGPHTVDFDVQALAAGSYFCRLQAPGYVRTQKLTVVH